jgi:DNA polymerase III sliding clamp (beta) subunit (PCNA family)
MIKVLKSDLAPAIKSVTRAIPNKPQPEILRFCRLQLAAGCLFVEGGAGNERTLVRIPAEGDDVVGCIDPRVLLDLIPRLPDTIEFRPHKNKLLIKRKEGNILLATADASAYPTSSVTATTDAITIPRVVVREMVKTLLCGTDEMRNSTTAWQNVVLIRSAGPEFVAVSSDGNRIALVDGKCSSEAGTELLVPLRALRALDALVNELPETVTEIDIAQDEHRIWIKAGPYLRMSHAKLTVKFPDVFGKVLTALDFQQKTETSGAALQGAIQLMKSMADRRLRSFRLEASTDKLVMATVSPENGEASEIVAATGNIEKAFTTGYNVDYLSPIFEQVKGETVYLEFADQKGVFPLKIVHDGEHIRSSWIVQSLNIYPGSKKIKEEVSI